MNKTQFRWLIGVYIILLLCGLASELLYFKLVPPVVRSLEPDILSGSMPLRVLQIIYTVIGSAAWIVGLVGLLRFWSPARYIFLGGIITGTFFHPISATWWAVAGWSMLFNDILLLLSGTILTISFTEPTRNLFSRKTHGKNTVSENC